MSDRPTCVAGSWGTWGYRTCDRPGKYAIRAQEYDYSSGAKKYPVETLMVCGIHRNQFNRRGFLSVARKKAPSFLRIETRTMRRSMEEE